MLLTLYTLLHVLISLIGIATGFIMLFGLVNGRLLEGWTRWFLWTTVLTSVTGFGFPVDRILPSHVFGVISLLVLPLAIYARSSRHLMGGWRSVFVVCAAFAQYLNVFVLVVQSFQKVPFLRALAPTQAEPPFALAQGAVLLFFIVLTTAATVRFRRATLRLA